MRRGERQPRAGRGILLIIILIVPLLGAGCSREDLSAFAQKAGGFLNFRLVDGIKDWIKEKQSAIQTTFGTTNNVAQHLDDDQKNIIDEWLSKNKLNEFGDSLGTMYTGGTPLFDEITGESINRFKYLFEKFPELNDVIQRGVKERMGEMMDSINEKK